MSAGSVQAAPLCKDLKGLFTPCPKALNKAAARRLRARSVRERGAGNTRHAREAEAHRGDVTPGSKAARVASDPEPHRVAPPPFVAGVTVADPGPRPRPKLCKDLKGLFTPCPK